MKKLMFALTALMAVAFVGCGEKGDAMSSESQAEVRAYEAACDQLIQVNVAAGYLKGDDLAKRQREKDELVNLFKKSGPEERKREYEKILRLIERRSKRAAY